ncbi:cysteinyl leukotriene receptor 1-like isoform 2-T2 [Pholidichthys leucotaenia]
MNDQLMVTPFGIGNNTTLHAESCFHDDDRFKYQAYRFTYLLVFPMAFLCNIAALVVFFRQRSSRNSASCVLMINLAISDSSFSLTLPLRLAYYFNDGKWRFSDWLCRLCVYCFYVNLYTSLLRWLAVTKPFRHRSLATPTRTLLVCLAVWVFVGLASAPFLSNGVTHRMGVPRCFEPSDKSSWCRVLILNYIAVILGFLLPFLTIIISYGRIVWRLMSSTSRQGSKLASSARTLNRRRSIKLVTMVTVTFLFCFLPYHVARSLHLHAKCNAWSCDITLPLQRTVVVALCLASTNSMVNPLLYYYSTRTFRDKIRDIHSSMMSSRGGSLRSAKVPLRRRNTT